MTTQRHGASAHTWKQTQRILVVDNDPNRRECATPFLETGKWDALEASSGRETLNFLDRHAIDMVLLDVVAQGVNGPEILRAIRRTFETGRS